MTMCRTLWIDNKTLKIANEDGYEKVVDTEDNFRLIAHNQIPLFNEISGKEWEADMYHIYKSRPASSEDDVKLKRLYQNYKCEVQLKNGQISRTELYKFMFQQDFENFTSYNHGFTLLQWQIVEQLCYGNLQIKDISEVILKNLIYAIFPGGDTVLHLIADKPDQIEQLLSIAHPDNKIKYHLPFLPNFKGKTPIHLCMENKAFKSIDLMLRALELYPIDHHSRFIKDCHSFMLKNELPEYAEYMESRFRQTPIIESF